MEMVALVTSADESQCAYGRFGSVGRSAAHERRVVEIPEQMQRGPSQMLELIGQVDETDLRERPLRTKSFSSKPARGAVSAREKRSAR